MFLQWLDQMIVINRWISKMRIKTEYYKKLTEVLFISILNAQVTSET